METSCLFSIPDYRSQGAPKLDHDHGISLTEINETDSLANGQTVHASNR
jgi:hypothetical protein